MAPAWGGKESQLDAKTPDSLPGPLTLSRSEEFLHSPVVLVLLALSPFRKIIHYWCWSHPCLLKNQTLKSAWPSSTGWIRVALYGDVLARSRVEQGVPVRGDRVHIIGPQGIFKPRMLKIPISITTVPNGPYSDRFDPDSTFLLYSYRGTDPSHSENAGLREAMRQGIPLVYFFGVLPGRYLPIWPVFIQEDYPTKLTFKVSVDEIEAFREKDAMIGPAVSEGGMERRSYITSTVRVRLHQRSFRERVLRGYKNQCSLCRLRHRELLDAAHIIADSDPTGEPLVSNGLALCKLHHAAFDQHFLAIRPDYRVEVRQDVLEEEDGPMLRHGLQGMHKQKIWVPRTPDLRPDPQRLAARYAVFRKDLPGSARRI